jgi:hypothetical protein
MFVRLTLNSLSLWERGGQLFTANSLEDWYTTNIWCRVLDDCFLTLPHVILQRKEVVCQSSVIRRNSNRSDTSSKYKSGPRMDGMLRSLTEDSHEFCAIEAAPHLRGGPLATKWLSDRAKLVKVMRDMLGRLIAVSRYDATIVKDLQVVGVSIAGLVVQFSRLCYGNGYVTLLATEPPQSLPSDIDQIQDLLEVLPMVLSIKSVLATTVTAFRSRSRKAPPSADATGSSRIPELPSPPPGL